MGVEGGQPSTTVDACQHPEASGDGGLQVRCGLLHEAATKSWPITGNKMLIFNDFLSTFISFFYPDFISFFYPILFRFFIQFYLVFLSNFI